MRTYKPGDKVRFLNEVGEGVVKFIRGDKVFVETSDGFEIPVKPAELIPAGNMSAWGEDEKKQETDQLSPAANEPLRASKAAGTPGNKESSIMPGDSGRIYLAVIPTNPFSVSVSDFELYLVNDSTWNALYTISSLANKLLMPLSQGKLEAGTKLRVDILSQTRISKENLKIQLLLFGEGLHPFRNPVTCDLPLHQTAFYKQKAFTENDFFEQPAFLECLIDFDTPRKEGSISLEGLKDLLLEKTDTPVPVSKKDSKSVNDPEQIDLHIHEIIDNPVGLEPQEILNIQMARFTTALETATEAGQKRIIFIHGIGNGRLKYEIRKKLDTDYPRLKYQDASFQEYGFGATLVFIH